MRGKTRLYSKGIAFLLLLILGPVVLIGVPVRVAFTEWFVEWEYSREDFPEDPYGMSMEERLRLAKLGLEAVLSDEGMERFRRAELPDGRPAFNEREIRHMEDVKRILDFFFPLLYASLILFPTALLLLRDLSLMGKALITVSVITLAILLSALLVSLVNYDLAFEVFHNYLFDPYSWRFHASDTLLRIYPMKFWYDATIFVILFSIALNLISVAVGAILLYLSWASERG
ncbi:MAG: TIGR01906 family membrane protein [Aquificota bacterium]|nr:TIGR01906 family membrane protein [Aquificota bacterium]